MNYILQIRVSHYAIDNNVMSYTILICIYQDEISQVNHYVMIIIVKLSHKVYVHK
jgi:hypothetical protein